MPIDREQFCVDSFTKFLREQAESKSIEWRRVPKNQDPPDYYLTFDGTIYAVEVTSTEIMRDVTVGTGRIQEEKYHHSHERIVEKVDLRAREAGFLSGCYIITFDQPLTSSHFRQLKKAVIDGSLDYINMTQHLEMWPEESIYYQGQRVCGIMKLRAQPSGVYEEFTDEAWTGSPEIWDLVCALVQQAVLAKRDKLMKKNEVAPKILLLLNTYAFADDKMYVDCVGRIVSLDYFHSVFIVWGDGHVSVLHSSDDSWARQNS
jgi:hypothetical protein